MTFEEKLKELLQDDDLVEFWVERAAIIEFEGEVTKKRAEEKVVKMIEAAQNYY